MIPIRQFDQFASDLSRVAEQNEARIEVTKSTDPGEEQEANQIGCCQALAVGALAHLAGEKSRAIAHYRNALTGDHPEALEFLSWVEDGHEVEMPFGIASSTNEVALVKAFTKAKKSGWEKAAQLSSKQSRGLAVGLSASSMLIAPRDHLWHSLKMIGDLGDLDYGIRELTEAVSNVGPVHNYLDADGIPIPGMLRPRHHDEHGWQSIDQVDVTSKGVKVHGRRDAEIAPLVTQDDIDIATWLVFFEGDTPAAPRFSLDSVGRRTSKANGGKRFRFNERRHSPSWLGEADFGKSMYLADWLMKSFTMKDGLPSLHSPFASGATTADWPIPSFMECTGNAPRASQGAESHGRLEIIVRSTTLDSSLKHKSTFSGALYQYRIADIDLTIDSSSYTISDNGSETHVDTRDIELDRPTDSQIIESHYEYISDLFPVFRRVKYLLALFSTLCQARRDGMTLSSSLKKRIGARIQNLKNQVPAHPRLSPKPFHKGGCYCSGGVSGRPDATVRSSQSGLFSSPPPTSPNFVVDATGWTLPVPTGAAQDPSGPRSGNGLVYRNGAGGHGFSERTANLYVMDAAGNHEKRAYYTRNFFDDRNGVSREQKIDPFSGKTVDKNNPWAHIYPDKNSLL